MFDRTSFREQRPQFQTMESYLVEVSGYSPIFSRVYETTMNDRGVVNDFLDLTNDGSNITSVAISNIASRVLRPSAVPQAELYLPGGVAERRLAFLIKVESKSQLSRYSKITLLSGYTDISDITYSGIINPMTKFYINSWANVNQAGTPRIVDNSQIFTSGMYDNFNLAYRNSRSYEDTTKLRLIRPQDMIRQMEYNHGMDYTRQAINIDGRAQIASNRNSISRRSNNMASSYIEAVVKSVIQSSEQPDYMYGTEEADTYSRAMAAVSESSITSDALLRELRQFRSFADDGYVTWEQLCSIIPDLDERSIVVSNKSSPEHIAQRRDRAGDSSDWSAPTEESIASTIVSQSFGAIMTKCFLTHVDCEFTNETMDSSPVLKINSWNSLMNGVDMATQLGHFEFLILHELMPSLTYNNEYTINVRVNYDITLDMQISVGWDGGPMEEFVTPTFCDSLQSPIITTSQESIDKIESNLHSFVDAVVDKRSNVYHDY